MKKKWNVSMRRWMPPVALAFLLLSGAGCGKSVAPVEGRPPVAFSAYRNVARQMDQRRMKTRCFRGMGRLIIRGGAHSMNSLAAVRIEPPYDIEIELIDEAIGVVGWLKGDFFKIEGSLNNHPIAIANDRDAMKKEMGVALDTNDLVTVMMGLIPQEMNERYEEWWINPLGRAESPDGLMEMLLNDTLSAPKTAIEYTDDDHTNERRRVVFDQYKMVDAFWVPASIMVQEGRWQIEMSYRDFSLNTQLGCEVGG